MPKSGKFSSGKRFQKKPEIINAFELPIRFAGSMKLFGEQMLRLPACVDRGRGVLIRPATPILTGL
jgi:hypothetical protein